MSEEVFLKCACSYCQGHLEFPAHAVGITTTCPHCGVETTLTAPASSPSTPPSPPPPTSPPPPPLPAAPAGEALPSVSASITPVGEAGGGSKLKRILNVAGSVLMALGVLAFVGFKVWVKFRRVERAVETVKGDSKTEPAKAPGSSVPKPVTPPPVVAPPTFEVIAKGSPPPRKPGEDLQLLSFEVQKAKDGNLQYIVGVVTNHAGKQFFNVKLEFELTRKDGKTGDTASDSIRNLPANGGVPFKANIIGTAPIASAKLMKLEGEKE